MVITDRWYESIILLAAHLNMPVELIAAQSMKVAEKYPHGPLTDQQTAIFHKNFQLDFILYEVSNLILDAKINGERTVIKNIQNLTHY